MRVARSLIALTAVCLATVAAPGCARRRARTAAADSTGAQPTRTALRVENRGFPDMTIYVIRSGSQRIRLGIAGGNRTTVLPIPSYLVSFPTPLRFLADPIGGNRTPVSDEITVSPGDEVVLTIPPR